jgi:hypothetical protein
LRRAVPELQQSIRLLPDAENISYANLMAIYEALGRFDEAKAVTAKFLISSARSVRWRKNTRTAAKRSKKRRTMTMSISHDPWPSRHAPFAPQLLILGDDRVLATHSALTNAFAGAKAVYAMIPPN